MYRDVSLPVIAIFCLGRWAPLLLSLGGRVADASQTWGQLMEVIALPQVLGWQVM